MRLSLKGLFVQTNSRQRLIDKTIHFELTGLGIMSILVADGFHLSSNEGEPDLRYG